MNSTDSNVIAIRPKVIFEKVEKTIPDTDIEFIVKLPSSKIGGLHLLESSILVSMIKLTNPSNIFEFGTYMGASTVLMASNSPNYTLVTTLDVNNQSEITEQEPSSYNLQDAHDNDDFLRSNFRDNGAIHIERCKPNIKDKIIQIFCNSKNLDIDKQNFRKKFELIFIDGGHDYETIENDTKKAFDMATDDAVIIWHDYTSQIHRDVTHFINNISKKNKIVHVQNTMLALHFRGKCGELIL